MLKVSINDIFLDEHSLPQNSVYIWAYHIVIHNTFKEIAMIKRRLFQVVDNYGYIQKIEGVGVMDELVSINPNEKFEYVSGIILSKPSGLFYGKFFFEISGKDMVVELEPFSLDSSYETLKLN